MTPLKSAPTQENENEELIWVFQASEELRANNQQPNLKIKHFTVSTSHKSRFDIESLFQDIVKWVFTYR